jgi:ATP-dependent RNA helicase HelY
LDDILADTEMAPGDFVRNCKQLADLLRQIEEVAGRETAALVREGRQRVLHGVVAYTGV